MSKILYNTKYYDVVLEPVYDPELERDRDGYALYNKSTGVKEFTSFIWPEMIVWITKLSEDIESWHADNVAKEMSTAH